MDITQITIEHFIDLVSQTGTDCLKYGKENDMGEARNRMLQGLPPRVMKPGEQIQVQVDLSKATPRICECGSDLFTAAIRVYTVSALLSPVGQELTAQTPVLVCQKCQKVLVLGLGQGEEKKE